MTTNDAPLIRCSKAPIRLNCPGSVYLEKISPAPPVETEFTALGTEAHKWAALALTKGEQAVADCPDKEMHGHVLGYNRFVRRLIKKVSPVDKVYVEKKVVYSAAMFGTADCIIVYENRQRIIIVDLKYGSGVSVTAEENYQLMAYLLCVAKELKLVNIEKATMIIYQPRARDGLGAIRHWTISGNDVYDWNDRFDVGIQECIDVDTGLIPPRYQAGTHCTFCSGKPLCKEYANAMTRDSDHLLTVISDSEESTVVPQETYPQITLEQLEKFMLVWPRLTAFAKDAKKVLEIAAATGTPLTLHKFVEGKSNRKWKGANPVDVGMELASLGIAEPFKPRELIGIPEAEKIAGKKAVAHLWEKPPGKPSLVPITNPKPALTFENGEALLDDLRDDASEYAESGD